MSEPNHARLSGHPPRRYFLVILLTITLTTLACSLIRIAPNEELSQPALIRNSLPTLTPTRNAEPTLASVEDLPATESLQAERPTAQASKPPATSPPADADAAPISPPNVTTTLTTTSPNPEKAPDATASPITSTPTGSATPTPTLATGPTATPAPASSGWSFVGVDVYPDEFAEGLVLYGDAINQTGATQELTVIRGIFYDGQGQVIADANSAIDYWPIDIIPVGARLPFELLLPGIQGVTNFDLEVEAQPGSQTPHQDFEILNLDQQAVEDFGYCLTGQVQNLGDPLQEYLIVMAVLYDSQDHVIKFGEYYAPDPTAVSGDRLEEFEICIELFQGEVARHEMRVWGE